MQNDIPDAKLQKKAPRHRDFIRLGYAQYVTNTTVMDSNLPTN